MVDRNNNGSYKDLIIKNKELIKKIRRLQGGLSQIIVIIETLVIALYFTFKRKGNMWLFLAIVFWIAFITLIRGLIYSIKKDPALYLENYDFDFYKEFSQYKLSTLDISIHGDRPFKNHTEWKAYIIGHYRGLMGSDDFYRQLILKLRELKASIESLKSISMPLEILLLTFVVTFMLEGGLEVLTGAYQNYTLIMSVALAFIFCVAWFVSAAIYDERQKVYFIKDLIEILFIERSTK